MRRNHLAVLTLILTVTAIAPGCQQATGPTAAGGLAPTGAAAPTLLPFGGATRVTPPTAGSPGIPNNYMGGAPVGQSNLAVPGTTGIAVTPGNAAIGSGVQAAGWTDANSGFTNRNQPVANLSPNPRGATFGLNPNTPNAFRQGGMQVNDLTNAPPPPGYRPPAPVLGTQPNVQPQAFGQPAVNQGFGQPRTIQTPTAREFAGAVAPAPAGTIAQVPNTSLNSVGTLVPLNSGAGNPGFPSTNPVNSGNGNTQSTLDWRRPGSQF